MTSPFIRGPIREKIKQGGIALELTMKLFLFLALIDDDAYEPFVQGRVSDKIGINICHICRCTYGPAV